MAAGPMNAAVVICEFPDDKTMAAASFLVTSTGAFSKLETTKLLTTAEAKEAMSTAQGSAASYKPPTG